MIILLRHATRERDSDFERDEFREWSQPLNSEGIKEAKQLGEQLKGRKWRPAVLFTSSFVHARQTAEILRGILDADPAPDVVELASLTPHYQGPRKYREWLNKWEGSLLLETMAKEAKYSGNDFGALEPIVLVLHKPRLQQVASSATGQDESKFTAIGLSEGICLAADSLDQFLQGQATEVDRLLRKE